MISDIIYILSALIALAYYLIQRRYSYWERLDVPYIKPSFPFGNFQEVGRSLHLSQLLQKFYNELKGEGQFGGIFIFHKPAVLATDLDFIKNILIKDFDYFVNRGVYYNEKDDPLSAHLFAIDGDKWKSIRSKLTPTFTSGKMKFMFPTILSVAEELRSAIEVSTNEGSADVQFGELSAKFTTDVIGTCVFGIECNSLKNPNSEFRIFGRRLIESMKNAKLLFMNEFPNVARSLKMRFTQKDVADFFTSSLKETIQYREENNVQRKDFLNLIMQLQSRAGLEGSNKSDSDKDKLTFNQIAAQFLVFFLAGFETSSTTMLFCMFELAANPDIQQKARENVLSVLQKHNGEFTYEAMMEMDYLDHCIQETLRKYPPVSTLLRICDKDYKVPNSEVTIVKGTAVRIPIYGIQNDPDIFPDPDRFDPTRFDPDEVAKRNPLAFMPFGVGPRNCIGLRFGLMQTRVGLATILKSFEFSLSQNSINPLVFIPNLIILTAANGVMLNIKGIKV